MTDHNEMLEIITWDSCVPGPHLLVLGAVHGDEICGPLAIRRVIRAIEDRDLVLHRGLVTFVPVCNKRAHAKGVRFAEKNLNRVIVTNENPSCYEERVAQRLIPLIAACDVLLDLHSFASAGVPFVFQENDAPETQGFARALGPRFIMTGWVQAFASMSGPALNEGDTVGCAYHHGKIGAVIECGPHQDPNAPIVAEGAIHRALAHLGMICDIWPEDTRPLQIVCMDTIVPKRAEGHFVKPWAHLDRVEKGELIARYDDGGEERAARDGFIILPHESNPVGAEWFYLGVGGK